MDKTLEALVERLPRYSTMLADPKDDRKPWATMIGDKAGAYVRFDELAAALAAREEVKPTPLLEFSINYMDGWMEGAPDEVLKHWQRVQQAATPARPAAEGMVPENVRKLIGRIDQFRMCMSYNESYFGEPPGLLKGVFAELGTAVNPIYPDGTTALYPANKPAARPSGGGEVGK